MSYSVFKLQNQRGKPSIFWEKETVPKNDRKFGYKQKRQRFPVRRFAGDRHYVESDMVSLSPDEPQPPPKPAKNFIKRNREKVTVQKDTAGTVTLTQQQLNAILKSVGKVAGGSENAVKISIGGENSKEIKIESPTKRDDYNDDYIEDEREKRRSKKKAEPKEEEGGGSIYSFLNNNAKPKTNSDNDGYSSATESIEVVKKSRRRRRERKHYKDDDDNENDNRYRKSRPKKTYDYDDDDEAELKIRKDHSKSRKYDDDEDDDYYERRTKNSKSRKNRSKHRHNEDDDDDYDSGRENRQRRNRSKKREESYDNEDDDRDNDTRERVRKPERTRAPRKEDHSKERREKRDRSNELDQFNGSESKEPEEIPSPRDKIGLPIDLSWRHMTKAERRRLEMARQKVIDEEERNEEVRKQKLEEQLGMAQRRAQTRSDPATRNEKRFYSRETDSHQDRYRRDPRSRSPEDNRSRTPERTPDVPSYKHTSPDTSPKAPVGLPRRHMTLAEKKKLEWERDRVESVQLEKATEPWGRPGAGAPLRSRSGHIIADYKGRQDHLRNSGAIQEEDPEPSKVPSYQVEDRAPPRVDRQLHDNETARSVQDASIVPHAMRSSFAFGQSGLDNDRFENSKEKERKAWLAELEKQIEEKRLKEIKNTEVREEDTWANKFGISHRPLPFPEQPKDIVSTSGDYMSAVGDVSTIQDSNRVFSDPDGTQSEPQSYIRGQNVPIDPVTKKELEDKRQRYLDHQTAIKAQVDEKERLKKAERDKKMKEDMEEERKLQLERDTLQKQFESEQQKHRQKEAARQAQVNQLKAAMDEAQARAMQEKYQRKMERLEAGGHDTKKLREHLEALAQTLAKPREITSRIEQLHTRRERDILRAQKALELQQWGLKPLEEQAEEEPKVAPSESRKPEPTAKITPRSEERGYNGIHEPSHVPGLDLSTVRTVNYQQAVTDTGQQNTHQPYTGNRVLTPSRFRHLSKPWSDPTSPGREFGTQTGDDVNHILNQSLSRDYSDVNIEFKMERGKRVRVISAPKETLEKHKRVPQPPQHAHSSAPTTREPHSPHQHHHEVRQLKEREDARRKKRLEKQRRHGPVKPGSRPMWGYKNPDNRKPQKQSEKDPFFEQKKRESDRRRLKREAQLLAMVEKNKEIIPEYYVPAERSARSRDPSPYSDFGGETPREVRIARRSKSHSPSRFNSSGHTDFLAVHHDFTPGKQNRSPMRDRSLSPVQSRSPRAPQDEGRRSRGRSPPIPAIKHKTEAYTFDHNDTQSKGKKGGKYKDVDPLNVPTKDGDFVPFTRTIDVLDPANAEDPMPLSREATRVANARKTYYESLNPEKFGNKQNVFQDKDRVPKGPADLKNPIFNPGLVTDYPTNRQDQILMQLSTLKQSLMQRQRELETFSPSDLEKQATTLWEN